METTGAAQAAATPSWNECLVLLLRLPDLPVDERRAAVEILMRNPSPGIRQQAFRVGASVLSEEQLVGFLRDDADAVKRNAGSEIFRLRGSRSLPVVIDLLSDPEEDVVLQAVLILARLRDPRALEALYGVLGHPDSNVVQEALLAIGQLGDRRSVPRIVPFLSSDPWVSLAAVQALGDLRAAEAVEPLTTMLSDPLASQPAAEALARIGGGGALQAVAALWLETIEEPEGDELVGLLAHIAEGLEGVPELDPRLRPALADHLTRKQGSERLPAARCLLALGPSPWDGDAARALLADGGSAAFPPALARRGDLLDLLLELPGPARLWALEMTADLPAERAAAVLRAQIDDLPQTSETLAALRDAVSKADPAGLAAPLLGLYLRLAPEHRALLLPTLKRRPEESLRALADRSDLEVTDAVALGAALGSPVDEVLSRLAALGSADRREVIARLLDREDLVRALPWEDWLEEDGDLAPVAADAAVRYRLLDLLPALRRQAERAPTVPLLLSLGELRDADAVPLLTRLLSEKPGLRPVLLESLGKIGDDRAREALRKAVSAETSETETRVAYRALAGCAESGDEPLFRAAARSTDWYIRLVAAEYFSIRDLGPESLECLTLLSTDPVGAVSQRALRALEG